MNHRIILLSALLAFSLRGEASEYSCPAASLDPPIEQTDQVLVPIVTYGLRGALGSVWYTELWVLNTTDRPIVYYFGPCNVACCCDEINTLPPQWMNLVQLDRPNGLLLCLPGDGSLVLQNRIHRYEEPVGSPGVELPVVPTSEFRSAEANLLDVSLDPRNRATVRLYSIEPETRLRVEVIRYDGHVLRGMEISLSPPATDYYGRSPGYAQILIPALEPASVPVRVRIRPISVGLRFWAFASVTNSETSQVTIIPPAW